MKRGMTLIEVLVAATLLAMVMGIVGGWTLHQARMSERVRLIAERQRAVLAIRELLRDDLLQALGGTPGSNEVVVDRHRLAFPTMHRAPGDGGSAGAMVVWWFDTEHHVLLRRRGDGPERVILTGLVDAHIERTASSTALHFNDGVGEPLTVALGVVAP